MKISDKIHQLKIPFTIPVAKGRNIERFVNIFLIFGQSVYLIDTGTKGAEKIIYEYLLQNGRHLQEIKTIFLTHSHPDHIGALKTIKEKTGCKVLIHPAEKSWVEDTTKQFRKRPVPGFHLLVEGSTTVDGEMNEGMILAPEEGLTFEVIHTPGHSDGSVSLLFKEQKTLFTGDAVILPGELPIYTNVNQYLDSIEKLKKLNGIKYMLSAWDEVKHNREIKDTLNKSIDYLHQIDKFVKEVYQANKNMTPELLCIRTLERMGLPVILANPLLAKSFWGHLN